MVKEKLMERYDWQQRTALLLGEEKMERIRNAHVLVVGLGGVVHAHSWTKYIWTSLTGRFIQVR